MIFPEEGDKKYLQHIIVCVKLAPMLLVKSRGSKHCLFRRCMILFMDLDGLSDSTVQESQRCVDHAFPRCELRGPDALRISLSLQSTPTRTLDSQVSKGSSPYPQVTVSHSGQTLHPSLLPRTITRNAFHQIAGVERVATQPAVPVNSIGLPTRNNIS
jgi:hypothetical protein